MAPSNLQGLNLVHPAPAQNPYLSDQDLLSVPSFPDLSAQLDLWTNLNFQSDEPLISSKSKRRDSSAGSEEETDKYSIAEEELQSTGKIAEAGSHENVVTGTIVRPQSGQAGASNGLSHLSTFDIGALLSSFGMDAFQVANTLALTPPTNVPSLAQLLSYHANQASRPLSIPRDVQAGQAQPANVQSATSSTPQQSPATSSSTSYPAPKRARTSRSSSSGDQSEPTSPTSFEDDDKSSVTPMTPSEDKRRRNTAASARFRLKKKEREAALEKKAKELEVRVSELEKECEALRRENGWLKGLVVGVTGAGAGAVQQQPQMGVGVKRGRDEDTQGLSGQA